VKVVGVDTETEGLGGRPWSVQWSLGPGHGRMALVEDLDKSGLKELLESPGTLTVVHNALFDVGVLESLGIHPSTVADTMVMAYLLGEPSLSLKVLAYRYAGMEMRRYKDVVREKEEEMARQYFDLILSRDWPDPEPVVVDRPDGTQHVKFGRNIKKRVEAYLKRYEKGAAAQGLVEYWHGLGEDRRMVEEVLGPLRPAYLSSIGIEDAVQYACMDADATRRIYFPLWRKITHWGLEEVFWRDMGIVPMVVDMMKAGMKVSEGELEKLREEYEGKLRALEDEIEKEAGRRVNPNSSGQVKTALVEAGASVRNTSAEELDKWRGVKLVRLVQDYRGYSKLLSTYIKVLSKVADAGGRVHTKLSITRTATGRLASSDPNLQNQPVRTEDGRRVRKAFVSEEECSLVSIDYSQIELRVAAHVSQDPVMLSVYRSGGDIHRETACAMFGLEPSQVDDKEHRRPAKTVNFGIIYGITAMGLRDGFFHEGLVFGMEECERFIRAWEEKYSGYFEWAEETRAFARRRGYVRDMFGRVRWVPEVYSSLDYIREKGLREAINTPIQSGAQGIIKEAMRRLVPVYRDWQAAGYVVRPLLQVHDELLWEVEDGVLDLVVPELVTVMKEVVELDVPVEVDVEVGKNWKEMKEWREA